MLESPGWMHGVMQTARSSAPNRIAHVQMNQLGQPSVGELEHIQTLLGLTLGVIAIAQHSALKLIVLVRNRHLLCTREHDFESLNA